MSPDPINTLLPPAGGVPVRMYDTGFGDCLLLAFRGDDDQGRYLLIDFGVHHNYRDTDHRTRRMEAIAHDIAAVTDSHLHVVAVTHEHTDHPTRTGSMDSRVITEELLRQPVFS